MITPRCTTLISAADLRAFRRSIAEACASADVSLARATAVLVPTRSAGAQLRRTLERLWLVEKRAVVLPDIVTRGEWYRRLLERAGESRAMLSDIEREVLLTAAAGEAIAAGNRPPFGMRPALVAEMLAFYDTLRRQQKSVEDFERLVLEDVEPRAEFDRGAERLLRQTRFLAAAFRAFEAATAAAGGMDEHGCRQVLLQASRPLFLRVVITMGDRASEPAAGLYPADFDLLSRLPHLESIDVVATRAALLAGLGERLRGLLPGIEERAAEGGQPPPVLVLPPPIPAARDAGAEAAAYFVSRDREEELRDVARRIKRDLRSAGGTPAPPSSTGETPAAASVPRIAVVFRRPLPYVYLGRTVFESARVEYQAADALPLAAEPFAAALDLVFSAVAARFARVPLLQLLRSPQFVFRHGGREVEGAQLGALDAALAEAGFLGGLEGLRSFAENESATAAPGASAALSAAVELSALSGAAPVSTHLASVLSFLRNHERLRPDHQGASERHLRARAAVLRILGELRDASRRFHDPVVAIAELSSSVRRWLESQTFTPSRGRAGIELVDAASARYGEFDQVHLAGLVSGDWPEAAGRNIFYPPFLLARLGWPPDSARSAAERALFADLLRLARDRVWVSCFSLEDDSIVEVSPLMEELERSGLQAVRDEAPPLPRIFADEALTTGRGTIEAIDGEVSGWVHLRASRSPGSEPRFHGFTGPAQRPGATPVEQGRQQEPAGTSTHSQPKPDRAKRDRYTVTGLDRYLECPFKYFARSVLDLPEENDDESGLSPRERGRFVHEVFRAFFAAWEVREGGWISVERLGRARALFVEIAGERLTTLPASEAQLEQLRLLGSPSAPGLGEVVLCAEAVRPAPVLERLLEFSFDGEFSFTAGAGSRRVRLRGKADRVDLLADGRMRIIDYKLGRAPADSIQLPVYALCLRQHLRREGRDVEIGEASYIAFSERTDPVKTVLDGTAKADEVLSGAQERVLSAIDGIERGDFPPRPSATRLCATCAYAAVCRKDYPVAD